jgi:hypothetical protein
MAGFVSAFVIELTAQEPPIQFAMPLRFSVISFALLMLAPIPISASTKIPEPPTPKAINGKFGYVDETGKVVIPPKWDNAFAFSEGRAVVIEGGTVMPGGGHVGGQWGFINLRGEIVVPLKFSFAGSFHAGLAKVSAGGKSGPKIRDFALGKYGFIDRGGNAVIPIEWDNAEKFSEGLAMVKKAGKSGFIDTSGKVVIAPVWDSARDFSEGLAPVFQGKNPIEGKWGFIDRTGKLVIAPEYRAAFEFNNGRALVYTENPGCNGQLIDREGKVVKEFASHQESFDYKLTDGK